MNRAWSKAFRRGIGAPSLAVLSATGTAQGEALLDVRNLIPGVLDSPVYDLEGVSPLDLEKYNKGGTLAIGVVAQVYVSIEGEQNFIPFGAPMPFGSGKHAGYWDAGPTPVKSLPWVEPGSTIQVLIRVMVLSGGPGYSEVIEFGESEALTLAVEETPIQLTGLRSFALSGHKLSLEKSGERLILTWWGAHYLLETTSSLGGSWTTMDFTVSDPGEFGYQFLHCAATNSTDAPKALYRLRRHPSYP